MRTAAPFSLLLALGSGCQTERALKALSEVNLIDDTTSTGDDSAGGTWSGLSTVTGATTSSGGESSTDASDAVGDTEALPPEDPPGPPRIVGDPVFDPAPIKAVGFVDLTVTTEGATAVRVRHVDENDAVALVPGEARGTFIAELPVFSGLASSRDVEITPSRGGEDGDPVLATYQIDLPEAGSEVLWTVDDLHGNGRVAAVAALPSGDIVEFGSFYIDKKDACYLRRRAKDGSWSEDDLIPIVPGIGCTAKDLEIAGDGSLHLLALREGQGGLHWWLGEVPAWGQAVKHRGAGAPGELGLALARSPWDGTLAVCGSKPTASNFDLSDAMVQVFRPGMPGYPKSYDYEMDGDLNQFDEVARGCDFVAEDRLVLVGEVFGRHVKDEVEKRSRRFDVVYDLQTDHGELRVAEAGLVTQSVASDLAVDDQGRVWILGHQCNDDCKPEGMLWMLDGDGEPGPTVSLGLHATELRAPTRIRWSPAKYLVVASGELAGHPPAVLLRAYAPLSGQPLWSYLHPAPGFLALVQGLGIGPYGEIYGGGSTDGFPLFFAVNG